MREVLIGICASAVITAVYKALVPSPKFSSQIKLLISCFFILSVTELCARAAGGELSQTVSGIMSENVSQNDYSVIIKRMTAEETAESMRKAVREELQRENISPEKIYIDVNISDSGSISIIGIRLVFPRTEYETDAHRAVGIVRRLTLGQIEVTAEVRTLVGEDSE